MSVSLQTCNFVLSMENSLVLRDSRYAAKVERVLPPKIERWYVERHGNWLELHE